MLTWHRFQTVKLARKKQDLRISSPKTITDHGTFWPMAWREEEQTAETAQVEDRHGGGDASRGQEASSEKLDPKYRWEIWGRPAICAMGRGVIPRRFVQSKKLNLDIFQRRKSPKVHHKIWVLKIMFLVVVGRPTTTRSGHTLTDR